MSIRPLQALPRLGERTMCIIQMPGGKTAPLSGEHTSQDWSFDGADIDPANPRALWHSLQIQSFSIAFISKVHYLTLYSIICPPANMMLNIQYLICTVGFEILAIHLATSMENTKDEKNIYSDKMLRKKNIFSPIANQL